MGSQYSQELSRNAQRASARAQEESMRVSGERSSPLAVASNAGAHRAQAAMHEREARMADREGYSQAANLHRLASEAHGVAADWLEEHPEDKSVAKSGSSKVVFENTSDKGNVASFIVEVKEMPNAPSGKVYARLAFTTRSDPHGEGQTKDGKFFFTIQEAQQQADKWISLLSAKPELRRKSQRVHYNKSLKRFEYL